MAYNNQSSQLEIHSKQNNKKKNHTFFDEAGDAAMRNTKFLCGILAMNRFFA